MPTIVWQNVKEPKHDPAIKGKIYTFLQKLGANDETKGLNVEPMQQPLDSRVRTARVDIHWRAVLFQLEPAKGERAYVYAGTWDHDEAIKRARTTVLSMNPVNGLASFRQVLEEDAEVVVPTPQVVEPEASKPADVSLLTERGFFQSDLVDEFGFDAAVAARAFEVVGDDALLEFALGLDDAWQADVLISMASGTALHLIKEDLGLDKATPHVDATDDASIIEALKHPAAQMQFTFIEGNDDEALRRVIDDGDFGAWRVFLHPEQRTHVDKDRKGSFRLTGGAGTGKTVVLLHRARHLAQENPDARIILTTFTRALADNLRRDLERLDSKLTFAEKLGESGILVRGVDQIAAEVRLRAGDDFAARALEVLGSTRETTATPAEPDWAAAIQQAGGALPVSLRSEAFFAGEYAQVILPAGITAEEQYFGVRRPGRGVALDRGRRKLVWAVIEQMRKDHRIAGSIGYGEIAAVSAAWLRSSNKTFADHVLIDEAQDLEPAKWLLLRALVAEGPNDLFIADDTHQRIYGQPTVLKRYGISIQGRSRRLTLNYRTTLENLRYAMGILSGVDYSDVQDDSVTTEGYRSARSGPKPVTRALKSDAAQFDSIAEDIRGWLDAGVKPETIAILAATNNLAKRVQQGLGQRDVSVALLTSPRITGGQPVVMTMHTAKGMEFSRVVLFDVSDGSFPPAWAYKNVPEEEKPDLDKRFRSLLYVAASRARDELVVTWKGAPSGLLLGA